MKYTLKELFDLPIIESIINLNPAIIYIYDLLEQTNVYSNEGIQRILGYTPAEIKGFGKSIICALMHPDDYDAYIEKILPRYEQAKDNEIISHIYRMRNKKGEWRWLESHESIYKRLPDDTPLHILGIIHDITERKQSEESLRESEMKYSQLVNTLQEGIWAIDQDAYTTFVNPHMADILGFTVEEMQGRHLFSFMDERGIEIAKQLMERRAQGIKEQHDFEFIRKDGSRICAMLEASPLTDGAGKYIGAIAGVVDITVRKRAENDKLKLEEQLRQSQKMEAIGVLAGGIAHDFNNILMAIIGYGSMAKERLKGDPTLQEFIKEILAGADRAAELTRGLLAFSRKQVISPKLQDLNNIVRNMEKMLRRIIGEDIEFRTFLSCREITVMVDTPQINQVLLNLVTNARDAMPDGGDLSIGTEVVTVDDSYAGAHLFEKMGRYAVLIVSDTGKGMDLKTRENIFEPFFTTKEMGKGTGLGLAMVYGIIKQHGGNINVYSEPGQGTTFRIYLPIVPAESNDVEKSAPALPQGRGETILIAEDDVQVRRIINIYLKENGYKVIEAENGEVAVSKFKENADRISVMILDVIMPLKNGRAAYDEIKGVRPDIKAIFMSGYTDDVMAKKGILEKGFDFISKPVNPDAMLRKIRDVLDR